MTDDPRIGRSRSGNPCAWCLAEHHGAEISRLSHSICDRHVAELKAEIAARKARRPGGVAGSADVLGDKV